MASNTAVVLAYTVTILLVIGGFYCLYVSMRMIGKRGQASGSPTTFSAEIAGHRFSIGTGSLAALVLSISVLWALAALFSRPKIEFAYRDGEPGMILRSLSSITIKDQDAPPSMETAAAAGEAVDQIGQAYDHEQPRSTDPADKHDSRHGPLEPVASETARDTPRQEAQHDASAAAEASGDADP